MKSWEPIADVLHEAAETHHVVWRITDGDDPDWASWYADWLLDLSELPALLGGKPVQPPRSRPRSTRPRPHRYRVEGAMGGCIRA